MSDHHSNEIAVTMPPKPIVLHIGDPIKYNHDFYNNEFLSRFDVVQATETDRESFIEALKSKKYFQPTLTHEPS